MKQQQEEEGKMFVGGLATETTPEKLQKYFSQWGEVIESVVMIDKNTNRSRGFGFVRYKDPNCVLTVLESRSKRTHSLDGKLIDPKPCTSREVQMQKKEAEIEHITKYKIFVGGFNTSTTVDEARAYFEKFGPTTEVVFALDKENKRQKGFGFVTFEKESAATEAVNQRYHEIGGRKVEAKRAMPRDKILSNARRSKQQSGGDNMMMNSNNMYYPQSGPSNYGPPMGGWMQSYGGMGMGGVGPSGGFMPDSNNTGYGTYTDPSSAYPSSYPYATNYGSNYNSGYSGNGASGYSDPGFGKYSQSSYSGAKAPGRFSGSDSRSHPYKK